MYVPHTFAVATANNSLPTPSLHSTNLEPALLEILVQIREFLAYPPLEVLQEKIRRDGITGAELLLAVACLSGAAGFCKKRRVTAGFG